MKKSFIIALHIGYWILYLLLIILFLLFLQAGAIKQLSQNQERVFGFLRMMSALTILPGIICFYTFYGFLFNKYLAKKRLIALCLGGLITSILSGSLGMILLKFLTLGKISVNNGFQEMLIILIFLSLLALIHGIIALVMKGFINWYNDIRLKELLQQKNFETELALVKSQLSPHFLFNSLNNIDVLIKKDAVKASEYLNKLSDIMRFMLYETKTEYILLSKELGYIEKYLALQKIRTANDKFVQYTIEGETGKWMIAPMLFIPFIENAFKHSVNKKTDHAIVIRIKVTPESLFFYCENHFSENYPMKDESGGIGNDLIEKRLDLLFSGKHELSTSKENNIYKVHLTIFGNLHT